MFVCCVKRRHDGSRMCIIMVVTFAFCVLCHSMRLMRRMYATNLNLNPHPNPNPEDTRPILASVTQPFLGGGCTPTYHIREGNKDSKIVSTEKGAGGLCESCCPGYVDIMPPQPRLLCFFLSSSL